MSRFRQEAEVAALAWKDTTPLLPDAARVGGPVNGRGVHDIALPIHLAHLNLLPEACHATEWFTAGSIPWHGRDDGGVTNHLLSSQVQCVNTLAPMAFTPDTLRACFEGVLDIGEPLPIGVPEAPEALVAFEWIPDTDLLGEWRGQPGQRGTGNTSVDAVLRYRPPQERTRSRSSSGSTSSPTYRLDTTTPSCPSACRTTASCWTNRRARSATTCAMPT